jgi:hypothetical protein
MPRILIGFGPKRERVDGIQEFNWTDANEPVNVDGIVCCTNPACGCDRSFHGILSRKTCTRAQVIEVDDLRFEELLRQVHEQTLASFRKMVHVKVTAATAIADMRRGCFRDAAGLIASEPVGSLFRIRKQPNSKFDLIPMRQETLT